MTLKIENQVANSTVRIRIKRGTEVVYDAEHDTDSNGTCDVDYTGSFNTGDNDLDVLSDDTSGQYTQQTGDCTVVGT